MKDIFHQPGLTEYEKAKLYAAVSQKYLVYIRQAEMEKEKNKSVSIGASAKYTWQYIGAL